MNRFTIDPVAEVATDLTCHLSNIQALYFIPTTSLSNFVSFVMR